MSHPPQVPSGNKKTDAGPPAKRRVFSFTIRGLVAIAALIFVMLFDMGELIKGVPIETIKDASMFAMPTELLERFDACDYKYLFFCDKKPNTRNCVTGRIEGPAQELNGEIPAAPPPESWWSKKWLNGNSGFAFMPWAKGMLMAAVTLPVFLTPSFPSCNVWHRGHLEFALGVLFVFAYITLMIVTLRQKNTGQFNFLFVSRDTGAIFGGFRVLAFTTRACRCGLGSYRNRGIFHHHIGFASVFSYLHET